MEGLSLFRSGRHPNSAEGSVRDLILYTATKGSIEIVAVAHGNRDIPAFIRRRDI